MQCFMMKHCGWDLSMRGIHCSGIPYETALLKALAIVTMLFPFHF